MSKIEKKSAVPLCGSSTVWALHSSWYPFTIPLCIVTRLMLLLMWLNCLCHKLKTPTGHKGWPWNFIKLGKFDPQKKKVKQLILRKVFKKSKIHRSAEEWQPCYIDLQIIWAFYRFDFCKLYRFLMNVYYSWLKY